MCTCVSVQAHMPACMCAYVMCVSMCACVTAFAHVPSHTCGGQWTTSDAEPHLLPCLRPSLLLYVRLAALQALDIFLISISCYLGDRTALGSQTLGLQHLGFCVGAGNLNSRY